MSIFSNRYDAAQEEATDYISAILQLLGDEEPLAVLERLVADIEQKIEGLSDDQIRRPETEGKWSIIEVIQHFADSDLVWAYRLRVVLADERPKIVGYDQDRWASHLRYREVALQDAIALLRILRSANLGLIRSLSTDELNRKGIHSERGEESVEHMIRLYAGHDLVHLRQIDRIRNMLKD